jgi:HAD superfamily hydrolase (TIGR01509 family)
MEIPAAMIGAIIFDFNGVIIDDEPLHARLLTEIANQHGLTIPGGDPLAAFLGIRDEICFERMLRDKGDPFDKEDIARLTAFKDERYIKELTENGIPLFQGIESFIERVAEKWPLAIASGALSEEIRFVLRENNLDRYFRAIAGGDLKIKGKPAPDVYLAALELMNEQLARPVAAADCLAIEDSPVGITSARSAGMRVLALSTSVGGENLSEADAVLEHLNGVTVQDLVELFDENVGHPATSGVQQ